MKWSKAFIHTIKEDPSEAEIISHKLMLRGSYMRKLSAGVFTYLPLGWRVLKKISDIIRDEMDKADSQELLLPIIHPAELWMETGRWFDYGKEMMRVKDRHERDYVLGPTHEEVITDLVGKHINSYKLLPVCLYQIQTKFRDEIRPRFGVMRGREFIMKDAYSFHVSEESLDEWYEKMYKAYSNIFERCGLSFRAVEADSGAIGGSNTHEFMVLAESGESEVLVCDCGYSATSEKAESAIEENKQEEENEAEKIHTPNKKSIEEVSDFLQIPKNKLVKTLIYKAFYKEKEKFYAVLIRGDKEINESKLKAVLNTQIIELASDEEVEKISGSEVGFAGPKDLNNVSVIADLSLKGLKNFAAGANEKDYHWINLNIGKDIEISKYYDVFQVKENDLCLKCREPLKSYRGIEVGQIFKLGNKYSKSMKAVFKDENGKDIPFIMGCYGIGVTRTMAAAIEQNYDKNGIKWPISIAPYHIIITAININNDEIKTLCDKLYSELIEAGYEVLYDDRDLRPGFKFKDADLIGVPYNIVVGEKGLKNNKIELKNRQTGEKFDIELGNELEEIKNIAKI